MGIIYLAKHPSSHPTRKAYTHSKYVPNNKCKTKYLYILPILNPNTQIINTFLNNMHMKIKYILEMTTPQSRPIKPGKMTSPPCPLSTVARGEQCQENFSVSFLMPEEDVINKFTKVCGECKNPPSLSAALVGRLSDLLSAPDIAASLLQDVMMPRRTRMFGSGRAGNLY